LVSWIVPNEVDAVEGVFVGDGDATVGEVESVGIVQMAVGTVVFESKFDTVVALAEALVVVVDAVETDIVDSIGATIKGLCFMFVDNVCIILLLLFDSDFIADVVIVVVVVFTATVPVVVCAGSL
jgi:hypothetical protein